MIKVMVTFEDESDIPQAVEVESAIHSLMHEKDWCTGSSTQNNPPKSWVFPIKEKKT